MSLGVAEKAILGIKNKRFYVPDIKAMNKIKKLSYPHLLIRDAIYVCSVFFYITVKLGIHIHILYTNEVYLSQTRFNLVLFGLFRL